MISPYLQELLITPFTTWSAAHPVGTPKTFAQPEAQPYYWTYWYLKIGGGLKFHPYLRRWSKLTHVANTVDGSEILRLPGEGKVVYPNIYKGFYTSQVVSRISSINRSFQMSGSTTN